MKTILTACCVGVVLYAASAAASWYLMNQNRPPVAIAEDMEDPAIEAGVPPIGTPTVKRDQLPVAIRPDVPLSIEAVLELSESIRRKERDLIAREKAVEKLEQNVQLLFDDLKVERAELTAMMDGLEAKLQVAQQTISELRQENQKLSMQSQELTALAQQQVTRTAVGEMDEIGQRVKTAKAWFEGLEDEQAASYLKEFSNNGDLRFAARLLKSLPQRKASKILAAFNDPELVQQILDALTAEDNGRVDGDPDITASRRTQPFSR